MLALSLYLGYIFDQHLGYIFELFMISHFSALIGTGSKYDI